MSSPFLLINLSFNKIRLFVALIVCLVSLTAQALAEETIFANYFDIEVAHGEGSEVFGRLHLKSNKNVRTSPIPSGYQFEIVSADSDLFELITQRDDEGRVFGTLRVRAEKTPVQSLITVSA